MLLANSIENLYCNLYCLSQKMKIVQMIGIKNVKAVGGYVQNIKKKKRFQVLNVYEKQVT